MTAYESKLSALLYRAFCPSTSDLGEYQLGILEKGQVKSIREHIESCPHCRRELSQLKAYLAEVTPDLEYSFAESVKIWIARLIPEQPSGNLAPVAFGLRGISSHQRSYQAGEAHLVLDVQEDPGQPGRKTLIGLLTGVDTTGVNISVWHEKEPVSETEVDELGNFVISGLDIGSYRLFIGGKNFEIHVEDLAI